MSKLMIAMPSDKTPPLYDFFNDELNEKQRQKLLSLFALMLQAPVSVMREPYVKHFTLERYSSLYELRAKSKTLVRIIFTMTPDGDVLFLTPFVKQHRRDTIPKTDGRYTRRPIRLYRPAALRGIAGHQRGPYLRNFHL